MTVETLEWLERLGLEKYAQLFIENEVDLDAARDLTEDDLKDLGIPLGPRKKLLRAIGQISDQPEVHAEPTAAVAVPAEPVAQSGDAERRHLTVMFCDLVGSTEHATNLDPEDMHALLTTFQENCGRLAAEHGGHVAKLLGDGLLIYFGYPRAQEDDAERAIRAGLAIVDAVTRIERPDRRSLQSRVGIASGVVVVGEILSGGGGDLAAVSGTVPHLAARLERVAAPNSVLIAQSTRRLVGELFELEQKDALELKGFEEPIAAFAVRGTAEVESRFAATRRAGGHAFVGRENELGMLRDFWAAAVESEGQAVLVSGEAGIGKSRLLAEFCDSISGEAHTRLRYQCSPQHTDAPLYPITTQLRRAAKIYDFNSVDQQADKLEILLRQAVSDIDTVAPVFAELLGIKAKDRYGDKRYAPEQFKALAFEALTSQFDGLAAKQPLLVLFEDLHWADPLTKELFSLLVARSKRLPVMILVTSRPEVQPSWLELAQASHLNLNRIRRRVAIEIARNAAGASLPTDILDEILERADGNPLFIEEITRSIVEGGFADSSGRARSGPAIPATLHDSLVARLDRLATEKDIAQIASVIGRTFQVKLLALASKRSVEVVRDALHKLEAAGIVYEHPTEVAETFEFKHALIRDAAYDSLTRDSRSNYHRAIAEFLVEQFPETVETDPGLVAQHFVESGAKEKALPFLLRAGQLAHSRFALSDAAEHLRHGIKIMSAVPAGQKRDKLELSFQIVLAPTLAFLTGYSTPSTGAAFERAHALLNLTDDVKVKEGVLTGLWNYLGSTSAWDRAELIAQERLGLAEKEGDPALLGNAFRTLATKNERRGNFSEAAKYIRIAAEHFEKAARLDAVSQLPHALNVTLKARESFPLWHLGQVRKADSLIREALELARKGDHPNTHCYALAWCCTHGFLTQDQVWGAAIAQEMEEVAAKFGMQQWLAAASCSSAYHGLMQTHSEEALAKFKQGRQFNESKGHTWDNPMHSAMATEMYLTLNQIDEAMRDVEVGLSFAERTTVRWLNAELTRLKGDVNLQSASAERIQRACSSYQTAMALANEQGSKMFELRSAVSLANTIDEPIRRTTIIERIQTLLSEIDAEDTAWDIQRAQACLQATA